MLATGSLKWTFLSTPGVARVLSASNQVESVNLRSVGNGTNLSQFRSRSFPPFHTECVWGLSGKVRNLRSLPASSCLKNGGLAPIHLWIHSAPRSIGKSAKPSTFARDRRTWSSPRVSRNRLIPFQVESLPKDLQHQHQRLEPSQSDAFRADLAHRKGYSMQSHFQGLRSHDLSE